METVLTTTVGTEISFMATAEDKNITIAVMELVTDIVLAVVKLKVDEFPWKPVVEKNPAKAETEDWKTPEEKVNPNGPTRVIVAT